MTQHYEHENSEEQTLCIEVPVFYFNGEPTCSLDVSRTCPFLGSRLLGTRFVCMLGERVDLVRGDGGCGYLIPHEKCRLHRQLKHLVSRRLTATTCTSCTHPYGEE